MKNRGFTLIELLIVVGALSILVKLALQVIDPFLNIQREYEEKRKKDLSLIQAALDQYYSDFGQYPPHNEAMFQIIRLDGSSVTPTNPGWLPYMDEVPSDPNTKKLYIYYSTRQSYYLYASLENARGDKDACNGGRSCASLSPNGIADNACGGICNYGVSSPNVTP